MLWFNCDCIGFNCSLLVHSNNELKSMKKTKSSKKWKIMSWDDETQVLVLMLVFTH